MASGGDSQDWPCACCRMAESRAARVGQSRLLPPRRRLSCPAKRPFRRRWPRKSSFDFDKTPLTDVVDYLKDLFRIEIQMDARAFGEIGSPRRHSADDQGIRHHAPRRLEKDARAERELGPWIIRDEVLVITTQEEADGFLVTKVYAVDDLPDSALPVITGPTNDLVSPSVISSDAVRAMVVTATYADQEQIAAKLAAARERLRSGAKQETPAAPPGTAVPRR